MPKLLRIALLIGGLLALIFAAGFFLQAPWATWIWPVPSARLSNIFVSSILASIGAPVVWIALADEPRAMAGGAFDLVLSNAAIAVAAYVFYRNGGPSSLLPFAAFAAMMVVLNISLYVYSRRLPFHDTRRRRPWCGILLPDLAWRCCSPARRWSWCGEIFSLGH